jgi:transposase-like protein
MRLVYVVLRGKRTMRMQRGGCWPWLWCWTGIRTLKPQRWLDATYIKVRRDHRIVSTTVIVAVGVNANGRREVLGMTTGHSEAEPFWVEFLRSLARRGLRGVKLVISDAHEGLKAAISKVFSATWQRCRVHFMRNALAYAGKTQKREVSAWVGTAFAQDDAASAHKQWRDVADQMRPRLPKLAGLLDEAEADMLAYMDFPSPHRVKIHSTNPLERLNGEIKRRADVVGIFPNDDAVVRLIGALLLEQNDEWATQRARYMTLETIAPLSDTPPSACQRWQPDNAAKAAQEAAPTPHGGARSLPCGTVPCIPATKTASGWCQSRHASL